MIFFLFPKESKSEFFFFFFFFFSKESKSEKKNCFPFEGVKVRQDREDWLV